MRAWTNEAQAVPPVSLPAQTKPNPSPTRPSPLSIPRVHPSLLSRMGKLPPTGPSGGLRINGVAARGHPLQKNRTPELAIRGSSVSPVTTAPSSTSAPAPAPAPTVDGVSDAGPEKTKFKPTVSRNVLLQRLQEAKADALRAQLKKQSVSAGQAPVELSAGSAIPSIAVGGADVPSVKDGKGERKKVDMGGLKKKILERLEMEKKLGKVETGVKG